MKDTNEQILDVLTEIRDMFSREIPHAIARTTEATQTGSNAQQRAHAQTTEAARTAANAQVRGAEQIANAHSQASRYTQERWTRGWGDIISTTAEGAQTIKERMDKIPKDFDIRIGWKVDPLPDIPNPNGESPETGGGGEQPGTPPPDGAGYDGAGSAAPGGSTDGGRGTQTIVVERDGQRDLQFTAENLPNYVRIRAGNTVLGV
jgi:hypothetical protein